MSADTFFRTEGGIDAPVPEPPEPTRRPKLRTVVVVATLACGAAVAVIAAQTYREAKPPVGAAAADTPALDVPPAPAAVEAPAGVAPVALYRVDLGNQVYVCRDGAFTLKAPEARLTDDAGRSIQHLGGPSWRSNADQSQVTAAKLAESPVPGAIPQLLLQVKTHTGNPNGELAKVTHIQRLRTSGGLAPAGACADGAERAVPYGADYVFLAPR